jgi:hypothetical protein
VAPGIDFPKLRFGRKLFRINFYPQISDKFPPYIKQQIKTFMDIYLYDYYR